jgi:acyl-CoA hydrolase
MMGTAVKPAHEPMAMVGSALQSVRMMQPQERNRAGKIFGGFLMHEVRPVSIVFGTRRVRLVRGEGRGVSD